MQAVSPRIHRVITPSFGFANTSFETPSTGAYLHNPTGGSWTFSDNSGIQCNGSAWGAPTAPDGTQTAFLQASSGLANGSMSQTVYFSASGTYALFFQAALRATSDGAISLKVMVDGAVVGTFTPTSTTSFTSYGTPAFTLGTAGNHTITFAATGTPTDSAIFINTVGIGY